jgi:hypothetical protein
LIHKVVGQENIEIICKGAGLLAEDQLLVDKILEGWVTANLSGQSLKRKVELAYEIIGDNPRRRQIIETLLLISIHYLFQRTEELRSAANAS